MTSSPRLPGDLARAIIAASPLGIVVTDAELDEPGPRLTFVNDAFETITGYARTEVLGRSPRFLQGPMSARSVLMGLREALRARIPFRGETYNYRADGTPFVMSWTVLPHVPREGLSESFVAFQEDVTERRQLESVAAAMHLMDTIGETFSGMQVEVRQPIAAVRTLVHNVHRDLGRLSRAGLASTLDAALTELARVEFMLRALRSFNAVERLASEATTIADYFERFRALILPDVVARGAQLRLEIGASAPREVVVDVRALHQVLLVLMTNALQAIPESTPNAPQHITLSVLGHSNDLWTVRVTDTGPGVPSSATESIFVPFFSTKAGRAGLGLSLARQLLARMGGTVALEAGATGGASFLCTLPLGAPESRT